MTVLFFVLSALVLRRLICIILCTEPSFADGSQALLKSHEPAIHYTALIYRTPWVIFGLGGSGAQGYCNDCTEYKHRSRPPEFTPAPGRAHELVRIVPLDPSVRTWSLRGLVQVIGLTEPADPANGLQTLLKCHEPAVSTLEPGTVNRTPRIVWASARFPMPTMPTQIPNINSKSLIAAS